MTFQIGMSYEAQPLERLLRLNGDSRLCRMAVQSKAFPENPRAALEEAGKALFTEAGDRELFLGFVRGFGVSGVEEQLEHLRLYAALAEQNLERARESRDGKTRLSVCLGLFAGVLVCLVLL